MATTSVDNLAVESPIYIENVSRTREHVYRATAADGLHRIPIHATEEVWNLYNQIPLVPDPALVVNGGPIGSVPVELVQMELRPVIGSSLKWEFYAWVGSAPPPPGPLGILNQLSRIVPATFGTRDNVPGDWQPVLTAGGKNIPYDGHSWIVDGLNHYVEFPYGIPADFSNPIRLSFYRYLGRTGGVNIWEYFVDATGVSLRPGPVFPGAPASADFLVSASIPGATTEGAGTRIMFDVSKGAVRAGTVSGSQWNDVSRGTSSMAFGRNNTASGDWSGVGAGSGNNATAASAFVGAGDGNNATAASAFVGAGESNAAQGTRACVGAGYSNTASADNAFVGAGYGNVAQGTRACVGAGFINNASAAGAFVGAGYGNNASAASAFVGAGQSNNASGTNAFVGAGQSNTAQGVWACVGAGDGNAARGTNAFVGAGFINTAQGTRACVGAGQSNTATADNAFVGAGDSNFASGTNAFVGAGQSNTAQGLRACVGAGQSNTATADNAFVGAGNGNSASGANAFAGAGQSNTAQGTRACVGAGIGNIASGINAFVGAGNANVASGANAFAAGAGARAIHDGAFVWSDISTGGTASSGNNQFVAGCAGGVTFYSNTLRSLGVVMPTNGSAWSAVCDQNMKENVLVLNPRDVLQRVDELPVYEFSYKGADAETRFRGPMAQDWHRLFPSKKDPLRIDTLDLDGVALAAIKGLSELVKEQSERIAALESRLGTL